MHLTSEVPYYQVIMFSLISKLSPHLIHASLTYDIPKLFLSLSLSLFNLVLAETWPKGTKGPFFLSMQLFVSFTHCSHHNDISQSFIKQNSEFIFLLFNPHMAGHSCPLVIDFFFFGILA